MTHDTENKVESSPDAELAEALEEHHPAPEVVMPDIYADPKPSINSRLRVVGHAAPDVDTSSGVNPYDTGVLQQSKLKS